MQESVGSYLERSEVGGAGEAVHSQASRETGGASKALCHFPEPWPGCSPAFSHSSSGCFLVTGMFFPTRLELRVRQNLWEIRQEHNAASANL